jgi:DNA invertase Pin-like site-specific DNA recombinase
MSPDIVPCPRSADRAATLIACVYARKSTKQSDVNDVEKSVTRQITLAKAFAAEKKWDVIETYIDDEVSGQEYARLVNRARLLADATAGKFQAVIVRDYDRISRDDREGPAFVYMLADAGVQVWEYLSRSPIKTARAMDRTMLNLKAGFASHEAEAASDRTREKKFDRAARGAVADGRVLGYKNVGEAKQRQRIVDPEQAPIVTRIFELAAQGKGVLKIASTLNNEGIVNPTGQSRGNEPKEAAKYWAGSGIRAILHRRLYLGELVYGQTKNLRRAGKRIKVVGDNPVTIDRPDLRIIPDELWDRAHRVLAQRRQTYERTNHGQLCGKPETGAESRWLLGGFVQCAVCGGRMVPVKRSGKRGKESHGYQCRIRMARGNAACTVRHSIPMDALHATVIHGLAMVLDPERLDRALQDFARALAGQHEARDKQRAELQAGLTTVESELRNLTQALAGGAAVASVLDGIKEREGRKRDIRARLDGLDAEDKAAGRVSRNELLAGLRTICKDWRALLRHDVAQGRRALRDLRVERVVVRRDDDGGWHVRVVGALDRILGGDFYPLVPAWINNPGVIHFQVPDDAEADDPSCTANVPPG